MITRIAHLTGHLSRLAGGPFNSVRRLAQEISARPDYECVIFGIRDRLFEDDQHHWAPLRLCPRRAIGPHRFGYNPGLTNEVTTHRPSLIHLHGLWSYNSIASVALCKQLKIPRIVSPRGMLEPWARKFRRARKIAMWHMFEKRTCSGAAFLHATSSKEADNIRSILPNSKIFTIPNGIDIPKISNTAKGQAHTKARRKALFLSRIHPVKGVLDLVAAWSQVDSSGWILSIAGSDEDGHLASVKALVHSLGIQNAVEFLGPQKPEEARELYHCANLFILPSYSENFGIVAAEAMAAGVPIVTTTGTPWIAVTNHEAGWITSPGSTHLATTLQYVLRVSEDRLVAMGRNGRAWMERDYSWQAVAKEFHEAYNSITGKQHR